SDHDDDDGGAAWRAAIGLGIGSRFGAASSARHCDRRRAAVVSIPDIVYDACDLPLFEQDRNFVSADPRICAPARHGSSGQRFSASRCGMIGASRPGDLRYFSRNRKAAFRPAALAFEPTALLLSRAPTSNANAARL